MIGYTSIVEQSWAACKHQAFNPEACPYPRNTHAAKEWLDGHFKARNGEHWNPLSKRKPKKAKIDFGN